MQTRILLVDDHEIVRRGLRALLETRADFTVCDEAGDGRAAVELARTQHPDVVIMDVNLPLLNGIEATRQIRQRTRTAEVLVLSMHESEDVVSDAMAAGARGYVFKSDAARDLIAAVDTVRAGSTFFTARTATVAQRSGAGDNEAIHPANAEMRSLTRRETEVLQLLAEGKPNKGVARILGISVKTVETHRARIMRKLNLGSVAELVRYALRNRIIADA
jgi:DNA-binding NarL/FixJ family response regulator